MNSRIAHVAFNTFREAVGTAFFITLLPSPYCFRAPRFWLDKSRIDIERLVVVNLGLTAGHTFWSGDPRSSSQSVWSRRKLKNVPSIPCSPRPVRRWEFVVGKFFGLTGTLVVNTFFMAIGVFLALLYVAHRFERADFG